MANPGFRLRRAVHDDDIDTVKSIISSLTSLDSVKRKLNEVGYNLLCDAIRMRHTEIAKELLLSGVSVNDKRKTDTPTPLHLAVSNNDMEIVDMLLERKVDISLKNDHGNPLDLVVDTKNLQIALRLMDRIVCVNSQADWNDFGFNYVEPSFVGYCQKSEEIVELFLSRDSEIPIDETIKTNLLLFAARHEKPNLVKLLLELGADVNAEKYGETVLQIAVHVENLQMVEHILKFCPDFYDLYTRNKHILCYAMNRNPSENKKKILDALLNYGFNIRPEDANNVTLLYAAVVWEHLNIVETLLKYGADVNEWYPRQEITLLHIAAQKSNLEIAKALINHGAIVNIRLMYSMDTPIHCAVWKLDGNMTKLLLASGADMKDRSRMMEFVIARKSMEMFEILLDTYENGKTILFTVINGYFFEVHDHSEEDSLKSTMAEIILNRGFIIEAKDNFWSDELHVAVWNGLPKVVEVLLEYGAKVDARYDLYHGMTPLMIAIDNDRFDLVKAILPSLPNFEITDKRGKRALDICDMHYTSMQIILELIKYGAHITTFCCEDDTKPYTVDNAYEPNDKITITESQTLLLTALNFSVNTQNVQFPDSQQKFYADCLDEIEEMKITKFGDSIFSVHDILTKDMDVLAVNMKNREITDALKTRNCVKKYVNMFPIYFGIIYYRFKKAIDLEPLLTPIAKCLHPLLGFELQCPRFMKDLVYLNDKDLNNLIQANPEIYQLTAHDLYERDKNNLILSGTSLEM